MTVLQHGQSHLSVIVSSELQASEWVKIRPKLKKSAHDFVDVGSEGYNGGRGVEGHSEEMGTQTPTCQCITIQTDGGETNTGLVILLCCCENSQTEDPRFYACLLLRAGPSSGTMSSPRRGLLPYWETVVYIVLLSQEKIISPCHTLPHTLTLKKKKILSRSELDGLDLYSEVFGWIWTRTLAVLAEVLCFTSVT
jgi:hypothetical protein